MTTLKLHKELYAGKAVTRAVSAFSDYGKFVVVANQGAEHIEISITAESEIDERDLAGEFANHVLLDSIETKRLENDG